MSPHSTSFIRAGLGAAALAAVVVLASGCASEPVAPPSGSAGSPGSTAPGGTAPEPDRAHTHDDVSPDHVDVAWLDGGRSIAVITWGSSTPTCRPAVSDASAEGQKITLVLSDRPEASEGCDGDLTPRADLLPTPGGVDPMQDVTVAVDYEQVSGEVELPGLAEGGVAGGQEPSAGWFGSDGIALLTYGSSSCRPHVSGVKVTDAGATATFSTTTGMCTMDMAPRVTPIILPKPVDHGPDFELTLVGDNLDATIPVLG